MISPQTLYPSYLKGSSLIFTTMSKISLPDDIERWEKKTLREGIGSNKEHTHTIYVHKNFAIEHEVEGDYRSAWNPYVLVNGHPIKMSNEWFDNFDEALGFIKGALKDKEIEDKECDEHDEPEFPKADACKSFVMPSAREMFAEAHALPRMDELKESCSMHRQQMREFFSAQKAKDPSSVKKDAMQEQKSKEAAGVTNNDTQAAFRNMEENSGKEEKPPEEKKKASSKPPEGSGSNDTSRKKTRGPANANQQRLSTNNPGRDELNPPRSEKTKIKGYDRQGRTLIPANTSWDRGGAFRNGMRGTIDYFNSIGQDLGGNAPSFPHLDDDLTAADLPISGIQELYTNNYIQNANAPNIKGQAPIKLNPKYMEQLNLLGLPDFTSENLLTDAGDIDGRGWTLLQRGDPGLQSNPIKMSNGWYRADDSRFNNFLRANMVPYVELGDRIESLKSKPNDLYDLLVGNVAYRDLVNLVRSGAVSGTDLNKYLGFRTPEEMAGPAPSGATQGEHIGVVEDGEAQRDQGSTQALGDLDVSEKSFRDIMEESIRKADADSGIPNGFIGIHPMKSSYKHVWLGYGKDATYPFTLKNAETGEVVCEVSDEPREEKR